MFKMIKTRSERKLVSTTQISSIDTSSYYDSNNNEINIYEITVSDGSRFTVLEKDYGTLDELCDFLNSN